MVGRAGLILLGLATCPLLFAIPVIDHKLNQGKFPMHILVTMEQGVHRVMDEVAAAAKYLTFEERPKVLYDALTKHANISQTPLLQTLSSTFPGLNVTSFWISNQISIPNAGSNVLDLLRGREDVSKIELVEQVQLNRDHTSTTEFECEAGASPRAPGYNLELMGVPELWARGVNGSGVVVGMLDTGVRYTHEALRNSYKNDSYSCYDPITNSATPYDDEGHGTMAMSLLAGGTDIGVAPGAEWVACKAFDDLLHTDITKIAECIQFFLCLDAPECSAPPRIWCNSQNLEDIFDGWPDIFFELIENAGILIVSSAGDYGSSQESGCYSIAVPAEVATILAVGATNAQDALWPSSSRGPSRLDGTLIKPEITAPGADIVSASMSSDTLYCSGSGTNHAAPQVAGVAALLLSMDPSLSPAQIRRIIQSSASRNLVSNNEGCGGLPDSEFPNFQFGHGRVDALAMYECVMSGSCLEDATTSSENLQPEATPDGSQLDLWLIIAGAIAAGVFLLAVVLGMFLRNRSKHKRSSQATMKTDLTEEYSEERAVERIVHQFKQGVWPQMSALCEVVDLETDTAVYGNYIALTQPYELEKYEIDPKTLELDPNRVLGSGEFGVVYGGTLRDDKFERELQVGIKKLKEGADPNCVASFLKELQVMIYVGEHSNIVQLLGACTQSNYIDSMCIVLKLCTYGNLQKFLRAHRKVFVDLIPADQRGPAANPNYVFVSQSPSTSGSSAVSIATLPAINTKDLLRWAKDIASGMEFLDQKKVVHGDLACRNVLLDENLTVKISDFGLASRLYEYTMYVKGTEDRPLPWKWMAPESLQDMKFSTQSDVWAFGVTVWEIFSLGEVPYPGIVWCRQFMGQLIAGYRNVKPRYATEEIYSIMKECWSHNKADRTKMVCLKEKLAQMLENQLFNQQ